MIRASSRHEFTVVVDATRPDDLPDVNVVVVKADRSVVDAATASSARSLADMWRMSAALSKGFDGVIFPTNYSYVPVRPGRFVTVVIHDAIPEAMPGLVLGSRRAQLLWNIKNRLACRQADLLATVSEASAREIRRLLPVGSRDLLVLTEGAAEIFSPDARTNDTDLVRTATRGAGRFILFVGGLSPHKRVAELVRAFGVLAQERGFEDLSLVLAGPDARDGFSADRSGVAAALQQLGADAERVVKTGFVSDETLAALYRQAACVVLPSATEGFGLPALEAMASGTPLIVARNPALAEVCGQAAEFVDDIARLSESLRHVLVDEHRRRELRSAGLEQARRFSWDESAQRLLAAFDRRPRRANGDQAGASRP